MKNRLIGVILEVIVPAGITRMPKGFGNTNNGKLKSEWHTLYSTYLLAMTHGARRAGLCKIDK
ncbi:hypothetical protein VP01_1264g7 [Puccinia sorghi]|uniref:Uncharacterized protein n=1 Tax=Puccinia sorghi TaxID=27349 RepID=A0A0L6VP58_9BASI|nr:hypothetical protein VP01_1264g7 [Puccinia sorghi]